MEKEPARGKIDSIVRSTERMVGETAQIADRMVEPYRKNIFERFPFLFIGLSTYGIVAVLFGFERLIASIAFLAERPFLILLSGIVALAATGTLYKKLR